MVSVNFERKIIYFHVPKTAGSYIQETLLRYYNFFPYNGCTFEPNKPMCANKNMSSAKYIKNPKIQKAIGINLEEYIYFSFVRNPYTRFISGWRFIVECGDINKELDLMTVIRNKDSLNGTAYNHIFMTQKEYLDDYILDNVGKYEDIETDLALILNEYNFEIKHIAEKRNVTPNYGDYRSYFTQEILDFVNTHFHSDFISFGYEKVDDVCKLNSSIF